MSGLRATKNKMFKKLKCKLLLVYINWIQQIVLGIEIMHISPSEKQKCPLDTIPNYAALCFYLCRRLFMSTIVL